MRERCNAAGRIAAAQRAHAPCLRAQQALERVPAERGEAAKLSDVAADAVVRAEHAIERDAGRAVGHALLAEAKRLLGDLPGAERAITAGVAVDENDPQVRHERATLLFAAGNVLGAQVEWQKLLAAHPTHLGAFASLGIIAAQRGDGTLAQSLVDHALATAAFAPLDILRRALQIALQAEPASVARGARLEALSRAVMTREPKDGIAALVHARALAEMGDRTAAESQLRALEQAAKDTPVAAEASRALLQARDPLAAAAIDSTMRAACETDPSEEAVLEAVASRGRRLGDEHRSWVAHLAAAVAERRLGRHDRGRACASRALEAAPSAPLVHIELAVIDLATGDPKGAAEHAKRALDLDPSLSRAREVLAQALAAQSAAEPPRKSWIDKLLG